MSTDLARRTPDDICREINACSTKLVQAEKKVEDWQRYPAVSYPGAERQVTPTSG